MNRLNKRERGRTVEQRAWWVMHSRPEELWRPSTIAAALGISVRAASNTLRRLLWKDVARREGKTHAVRWYATGVRPDDLRGTAVGSGAVFKAKAKARRKPRSKAPRARKSTVALDRYWGVA